MTLAPEMCGEAELKALINSPIQIAAGHSAATYEQATEAFGKGIQRVTHLFNAMSQFQSREVGLVGATYDSDAWASIIADGIHVDYAAIRLSKKMMGKRLFLITDAVTEDTRGEYSFRYQHDRFVDDNGILSGSALSMIEAIHNCVKYVGIPLDEALRMVTLYPAQVAEKDSSLGRVSQGYRADLVVFDDDFVVKAIVEQGMLEWF
jgi:N-acetylglucosamine-6-phosphate deacetylase